MTARDDPRALVGRYVNVYSMGAGNSLVDTGKVVWFHDGPMIGVLHADDSMASWGVQMRIEEIDPPAAEPEPDAPAVAAAPSALPRPSGPFPNWVYDLAMELLRWHELHGVLFEEVYNGTERRHEKVRASYCGCDALALMPADVVDRAAMLAQYLQAKP